MGRGGGGVGEKKIGFLFGWGGGWGGGEGGLFFSNELFDVIGLGHSFCAQYY